MEWDPDNASSKCVICEKSWGTFRNRRHHCRNCGRLVCESCSKKKLILDTNTIYHNNTNPNSKASTNPVAPTSSNFSETTVSTTLLNSEGVNQSIHSQNIPTDTNIGISTQSKPQRVCDACYTLLTKKKQIKFETNHKREREQALLHMSSHVSDSLVRIFFLDGSFKTIVYNNTTTAQDIASMLCYSVNIALFEVFQDIHDPEHFRLILPRDTIDDIIIRWELNNVTASKIVIPLYDFNSSKLSQAPPVNQIIQRVHTLTYPNNSSSNSSGSCNNTNPISQSKRLSSSGNNSPPRGKLRSQISSKLGISSSSNSNSTITTTTSIISNSNSSSTIPNLTIGMDGLDDSTLSSNSSRSVFNSNTMGFNSDTESMLSYPSPRQINSNTTNFSPSSSSNGGIDVIETIMKEMVEIGMFDSTDISTLMMPVTSLSLPSGISNSIADSYSNSSSNTSSSGNALHTKKIRFAIQKLVEEIVRIRSDVAEVQSKYEIMRALHNKRNRIQNSSSPSSSLSSHPMNEGLASISDRILSLLSISSIPMESMSQTTVSDSITSSTLRNTKLSSPTNPTKSIISDGITTDDNSNNDNNNNNNNNSNNNSNVTKRATMTMNTNSKSLNEKNRKSFSAISSDHSSSSSSSSSVYNNSSVPGRLRSNSGDTILSDRISAIKLAPDQAESVSKRNMKRKSLSLRLFKRKSSAENNIDNSNNTTIVNKSAIENNIDHSSDSRKNYNVEHTQDITIDNRNAMKDIIQQKLSEFKMGKVDDSTVLFFKHIKDIEAFIIVYDNILRSITGLDNGISDNSIISPSIVLLKHIYEISVAMEGVYEYILITSEQWKAKFTSYILRLFGVHLCLPVSHPDILGYLIQILIREDLLNSPIVYESVKQVIDNTLDRQSGDTIEVISPALAIYKPSGNTTTNTIGNTVLSNTMDSSAVVTYETMFYMMNRIATTLQLVIGDLMPLFQYSEFNLMALYQNRAYEKVRDDITTYYVTNKVILPKMHLLLLLTFVNHQYFILSKYSHLDVSLYLELSADITKQLVSVIQTSLKSLIPILLQSDEKSELKQDSEIGIISSWPSLLLLEVNETITATIRDGLSIASKESILTAIFEVLPELPAKMIAIIEKIDLSKLLSSVDRFCSYISNHTIFIMRFSESMDSILDHLDGISQQQSSSVTKIILSKFQDYYTIIKNKNIEAIHKSVEAVFGSLRLEFREILKQGLFRSSWENDVRSIQSVQHLLNKYKTDLSVWLKGNPEIAAKAIVYAIRVICDSYVELLLLSTIQMTPKILDRLLEDYQMLSIHFQSYDTYFHMVLSSLNTSNTITNCSNAMEISSNSSSSKGSSRLSRLKRLTQSNKSYGSSSNNNNNIALNNIVSNEIDKAINIGGDYHIGEETSRIVGLEACLKPWKDILKAFSIDNRIMADFVRNELYIDFGPNTVKVWYSIMNMRGENKKVVDVMYDLIMKQWNPKAITPLNSITYQDKLKGSKR